MFKALRLLPIFVLLAVMMNTAMVSAQVETELIAYNEVISGQMTTANYSFDYAFSGEAGDVIVILLEPVELYSTFEDPIIMMTDSEENVIIDTSDVFVFGSLQVAIELPTDDIFTVHVTRKDGAQGSTVGEFTLELVQAELLSVDEVVEGRIESTGRDQYYAIRSDVEFGILYVKNGGDMNVALALGEVTDKAITVSAASDLAEVSGEALTEIALGIFEPNVTYLLTVKEPLLSFNFNKVTADYSLEILSFD